jgi:hypothetical protein
LFLEWVNIEWRCLLGSLLTIWLVWVLDGNKEVLSNIFDFAVSHIIIFIVIIVIVRDVVDDIGSIASLTGVLGTIALTLWLTLLAKFWSLLDDFTLWVDTV